MQCLKKKSICWAGLECVGSFFFMMKPSAPYASGEAFESGLRSISELSELLEPSVDAHDVSIMAINTVIKMFNNLESFTSSTSEHFDTTKRNLRPRSRLLGLANATRPNGRGYWQVIGSC